MNQNKGKTLTVFTPAYNRRDKLGRLYDSLLAQTNTDFMWLVVDDGSEDGTDELIHGFQAEGKLEIRYFKQPNGGKMRAHNTGAELAETPLFVCLDSDDHFTKNAVDDILTLWNGNTDEGLAGIVAHKGSDEEHILYGAGFPREGRSTLSGLYKMGFHGETTLVFRTDVIRRFPFPDIPNEKYVPEDVVYDRIDAKYELLVLDKILTVCELVEEGLTDRVDSLREENPTGWFIYYYQRSLSEGDTIKKLKYLSHYLRFKGRVAAKYRNEYALPLSLRLLGTPGAAVLALRKKL